MQQESSIEPYAPNSLNSDNLRRFLHYLDESKNGSLSKFNLLPTNYQTVWGIDLKFIGLIIILLCRPAFARTDGPALRVHAGGGFSTHKSKVVNMNDTSTAIGYGFDIKAGNDGDLGVNWEQFTSKTKFVINDSESKIDFQDTSILLNMGSFYVGPVFSKVTLDITIQGVESLSALGSGYGGHAGFSFDVGKVAELYFDGKMVLTSVLKAEDGVESKLGSRTDFKLGGKMPITKRFLSLDIAWRMQSWPVTLGGVANKETLYTTWLGLVFNFNI